jgi:hypothetical protein
MAQHCKRFAGISAFLLRLWDGSGLISPVTHRCLASSSFRARGYVYSQADFFVGTGNAISFPRSSPALFHSHPHWQRTESHNRGFFRNALHTAHDLIHMVPLHRESDRDLGSLIATGFSVSRGRSVQRTDRAGNGTAVPDGITFRPFSINFDGYSFGGAGGWALNER